MLMHFGSIEWCCLRHRAYVVKLEFFLVIAGDPTILLGYHSSILLLIIRCTFCNIVLVLEICE